MATVSYDSCFWAGSVAEFRNVEDDALLSFLCLGHRQICLQQASEEQCTAWKNSIVVLKSLSKQISQNFHIIFEYVLPRERGRRPDVLLLSKNNVYVLEFKDSTQIGRAYIDQVDAYARDLMQYHATSRDKKVVPILLMTKLLGKHEKVAGVHIYGPDTIIHDLPVLIDSTDTPEDLVTYLAGDYAPLPSLVAAAKLLFEQQPLPRIRRAESAGIPQALKALHTQAETCLRKKSKTLALVTGVPGAGKTLVGLQFSYDQSQGGQRRAVYLSGNGPLVKVLEHVLGDGSKAFVQGVHDFLKQYGGLSKRKPEERIWIYDEAQRAWDDEKSQGKRGNDALSEPKDFVRLASRIDEGVMVVGLIGEGQEIHLGEEAGIVQWNDALATSSEEWSVICPPHIAHLFSHASKVIVVEQLNLNTSLRTHRASLVQSWVDALLKGETSSANAYAQIMYSEQYPIYITRDVRSAKRYVRERYKNAIDKRYGLLSSCKATNLSAYGIDNGYFATRKINIGPWFNDVLNSPHSCCQLEAVITEFQCQGLELDFPIVCWGNDLRWGTDSWIFKKTSSKAKNPNQLRLNSYRVLLTRGRDGVIIFVPPDKDLDSTWQLLVTAGCQVFGSDGGREHQSLNNESAPVL